METMGGTIATLGIHTINANELDEKSGLLNVNNRAQLQLMCNHFSTLLRDRMQVSAQEPTQIALWHEKLAELDAKYNIQQFIFIAMDLPDDHANIDIVNRILDLLDALRKTE